MYVDAQLLNKILAHRIRHYIIKIHPVQIEFIPGKQL
jgi:hypothetical protein